MDETRIEATAGEQEEVPRYLSNCDPGDESEAVVLEAPPLADAA